MHLRNHTLQHIIRPIGIGDEGHPLYISGYPQGLAFSLEMLLTEPFAEAAPQRSFKFTTHQYLLMDVIVPQSIARFKMTWLAGYKQSA